MRLLLADGRADVTLTDRHGDSALSLAEQFGHREVAALLRADARVARAALLGARDARSRTRALALALVVVALAAAFGALTAGAPSAAALISELSLIHI